jgi:biotin carboxyl carrier protein
LAREIVEVPLSGKITTVECKVGSNVAEGDVICYIESMKMENAIMAPVAGKITEIKVSPQQVVDTGELIAVIEY